MKGIETSSSSADDQAKIRLVTPHSDYPDCANASRWQMPPYLQAITLGNKDDLTLTGHTSVLIAGSGIANVVNLQDSGNDVVVLAPASNPGYGGDVVYGGAGHDIIITTAAIEEYGGTNPSYLYGGTGDHQIGHGIVRPYLGHPTGHFAFAPAAPM
jgi:hypothetical protein